MKKLSGFHLFVGLIVFAVVAVAGVGMYISGTPSNARQLAFDARRVNELQQISYSVDQFYNLEKRLPATLDELKSHRDVYVQSIFDPETGGYYEYQSLGASRYELCAIFHMPTQAVFNESYAYPAPVGPYGTAPDFWNHPAGHHCYSLESRLNPSQYPPKP